MTIPRILPIFLTLLLAACSPDRAPPAGGGLPGIPPASTPTGTPLPNGQPGVTVSPADIGPADLGAYQIKDTERHYRPATYEDMTGRWEQVNVSALAEIDIAPPWYSGPQMFEFTEDGRMKTFLVPPPDVRDFDTAYAEWRGRSPTIEFQFLDDEGLIEVKEPTGNTYVVVGTYYTRDYQDLLKGDLSITYIDKKTNASLFYRLLRPVE